MNEQEERYAQGFRSACVEIECELRELAFRRHSPKCMCCQGISGEHLDEVNTQAVLEMIERIRRDVYHTGLPEGS